MQLAAAIGIAALLLIPEVTPITDDNRALVSNQSSKSLSKSSKSKSSKSSKSKSLKSSKSKSSKSKKSKSSKSSKSKSSKSKSSKSSKISKSSRSKHQPQEHNILETQEIENYAFYGICGMLEEAKEDLEAAVLDYFEEEFDNCSSDRDVQSVNLVQ